MCGMPDCSTHAVTKRIQTTVKDSQPVDLRMCPSCDVRICGWKPRGGTTACDAKVADPFTKRCPRGHLI